MCGCVYVCCVCAVCACSWSLKCESQSSILGVFLYHFPLNSSRQGISLNQKCSCLGWLGRKCLGCPSLCLSAWLLVWVLPSKLRSCRGSVLTQWASSPILMRFFVTIIIFCIFNVMYSFFCKPFWVKLVRNGKERVELVSAIILFFVLFFPEPRCIRIFHFF